MSLCGTFCLTKVPPIKYAVSARPSYRFTVASIDNKYYLLFELWYKNNMEDDYWIKYFRSTPTDYSMVYCHCINFGRDMSPYVVNNTYTRDN